MLKFCQHTAAAKSLADTGTAPLLYTQVPTAKEAKNDKMLDAIAKQVFAGTGNQPLHQSRTALLHSDDSFWGVDPILDPKGEANNFL